MIVRMTMVVHIYYLYNTHSLIYSKASFWKSTILLLFCSPQTEAQKEYHPVNIWQNLDFIPSIINSHALYNNATMPLDVNMSISLERSLKLFLKFNRCLESHHFSLETKPLSSIKHYLTPLLVFRSVISQLPSLNNETFFSHLGLIEVYF